MATHGSPPRSRTAPISYGPSGWPEPTEEDVGSYIAGYSAGPLPIHQRPSIHQRIPPIPRTYQPHVIDSRPPVSILRKPKPEPYNNKWQRLPLPPPVQALPSPPPPPVPSRPLLRRSNTYTPAVSSPLSPVERPKPESSDDLALIGGSGSSSNGSGAISRTTSNENNSSGSPSPNVSPAENIQEDPLVLDKDLPPLPAPNKLKKNAPTNWMRFNIPPRYSMGYLHNIGRNYDRYPRHYFDGSGRKVERDRLLLANEERQPQGNIQEMDPEKDFSPYIDDRIGTKCPYVEGAFPMLLEDKEGDDYLHEPDDRLDRNQRPPMFRDLGFRGCLNIFCVIIFLLGLVTLFIVYPIVYFRIKRVGSNYVTPDPPKNWSTVNERVYDNVKGIRTNMIDPDTPRSAYTRKGVKGNTLNLVFSDEFNKDGRTFYPGDDQFWQAVNLHYHVTGDQEWYDEDAITTKDGTLRIRMDRFTNHDLSYRSGMLQSWNKLCFKGGILEVSVSLPGPAGVPGLWPGIWTLGNLGRAGYQATTEGIWPYSYDTCDAGITPNQSTTSGLSWLPGQKLNSCTCKGEDHPNPGVGRGAQEIDVFEATANGETRLGQVSQSLQVAPFDLSYTPNYDYIKVFNRSITNINSYKGGVYQQAISGLTSLNSHWYDNKQYQKYAFEYQTKTSNSDRGFITWYVGDEPAFTFDGESTGPNGNIKYRDISLEPMSIIMNLGLSSGWTWIDYPELVFPATMYIDYVRIYQPPGSQSLTCDPPGFPTTKYIKDHWKAYQIWNYTTWEKAGYKWPKNTWMNKCNM